MICLQAGRRYFMYLFCFLWAETLSAFDFRLPFQGCLYSEHSVLEDIFSVFSLEQKADLFTLHRNNVSFTGKILTGLLSKFKRFSLSSFGSPYCMYSCLVALYVSSCEFRTQKPCKYWCFFFLTTIAINSDSLFLMQESCVLRQYSWH